MLLLGCTPNRLELISLDMTAIDPPAPRPFSIEPQRCEWWEDDAGGLWLGLQSDVSSLLGPGQSFRATLKLDKLPSGAARNYTLNFDSLRAALKFGPVQARFVSQSGVVAAYREPGDRLRISLRALVTRHGLGLIGDWSRGGRTLWLATFTASRAAAAARADLVAETETSGFERKGVASRPVASQPIR
jgi:hypothetical protein